LTSGRSANCWRPPLAPPPPPGPGDWTFDNEAFARAGADRIIVHAEATAHLDRTLQLIAASGKAAGRDVRTRPAAGVLARAGSTVQLETPK
jgi:hypothetical protein